MNSSQIGKNNKRKGKEFQEIMYSSWNKVRSWRMTITDDGSAGERPGDDIILTENLNILAEYKTTEKTVFFVKMLESGQLKGLVDFSTVIPRNKGIVVIRFEKFDKVYAFELTRMLEAMVLINKLSLGIETIIDFDFVIELPKSLDNTYCVKPLIHFLEGGL